MNREDLELLKIHLTQKQCHLLWRDEIGDLFFLTKKMEVYIHSKTSLRCICWNVKTYSLLKNKGLISHEMFTDDPIISFRVSVENLPLILSLGSFKRRPDKNGTWLRVKEKLLGHKILPCNPINKILSVREFPTFHG